MSSLEEHEAEQAEITALCKSGQCDHPECHDAETETDGRTDAGAAAYNAGLLAIVAGIDLVEGSDAVVTRSLPRWAWDVIDMLLATQIACETTEESTTLTILQTLTITAMVTAQEGEPVSIPAATVAPLVQAMY